MPRCHATRRAIVTVDIGIHDLRVVRAVADTGSVSGAATELGMREVTLTKHLCRVERIVGSSVFRSHGEKLVPTPAGSILLRRGETILPLVDQIERM